MKPNQKRKYNEIEKVEVSKVFGDLAQEVIQITSDKLKLILYQYLGTVETRRQWIAPAGILATLIVVFPTTKFNDWFLPADTWRAIFVISTAATLIWLILSVIRIRKPETIDGLVERIKQQHS